MAAYRVLMVHPGGNWGGSSIALLKVAEALRQSGSFVPYLVFSAEGTAPARARELGFPVYVRTVAGLGCILVSQPVHIPTLIRFPIQLLPSYLGLTRLIRELEIDLVYLNTSTPVGAAFPASTQHVPILWHVREVINTDSLVGRFVAWCVRRLADVIIANSDYSGDVLRSSGRVQRVYDGVPLARAHPEQEIKLVRQQWGFNNSAPVVGMISPVTHTKGQWILLDAIPEIVEAVPQARFVIVGGSTLPESYWRTWRGRLKQTMGQRDFVVQLKQYARNRGVDQVTHFDGWRMDIPLVVSALDVVVFASTIPEGFGRPQVEAGSAGRPVVASDIGPARELIEDGVTGILVPPGDAEALAGAVITLLQDKQRAIEMGLAGRKRVERAFSDDVHAREIIQMFESVARHHIDTGGGARVSR